MTTRRKIRRAILLVLLIIPASLLVVLLPQNPLNIGWEMAFTIIGIPILILNYWELSGVLH